MFLLLTALLMTQPITTTAPAQSWTADPAVIAQLEAKDKVFNYREETVPLYTLPNPLVTAAGKPVTTAAEWEKKRRPELLALFQSYIYGKPPTFTPKLTFADLETNVHALNDTATLRRTNITVADLRDPEKTFTFPVAVFTPNHNLRAPCFLLINNRGPRVADPTRARKSEFWPVEDVLKRGYAIAVVNTADLDPDKDGPEARAQGIRGVWPSGGGTPEQGDEWATISAWAYGCSQALTYLRTLPAIDADKIAIIGHSRGGKTALLAGAQDTRFGLVISNCSGETGAAISRRRFGETVLRINTNFPYWFNANYKQYNDLEHALPVDQHEFLALIAPRPLAVGSANEDLWADPKGEYLSICEASKVYAHFYNTSLLPDTMPPLNQPRTQGPLHYHIRPGIHDLNLIDWTEYMNFADSLWPQPK